ncbi:MAG: polysaccharide biosynthesis/export family protein [Muribaculaceae bacterium]|nr:polysaccharide biosynthesis/export family protein [Muribaculaceae bacterium]
MNIKTILAAGLLALSMASCSSSKTVLPYFTELEEISGELPKMNYLPEIQSADELFISVSSTNVAATTQFNLPFANPASNDVIAMASTPRTQTYVVDSKGDITFPVLGEIHVAGMTTEALKEYLTERISKYVENPIVNVSMLNFRVAIAGEVKTPMNLKVNGPRITITEALAAAGDLTEYGERSNVLVIREQNGERTYARLNLNSADILTSPYYYLQQNDYVYVSPNKVRQANSKYNQNNAYKLSVTSTIVSAASVIASLVIALTVK